jgi:hypothetical protein
MRAAFLLLVALALLACGKKPSEEPTSPAQPGQPATTGGEATKGSPTLSKRPAAAPATAATLPAGTLVVVRLGQTLGSKASQSGETFTATVTQPVEVNGKVVIPEGAEASGSVVEAVPLGRFKGGARLKIALDSVTVNGAKVPLQTAAYSRAEKGKGKRTAGIIGGGAGLGAIIGGIAGGGKGAAIGALAGAGAGTAGAAFTGNKDIVLPAESIVSFKLLQPAEIK